MFTHTYTKFLTFIVGSFALASIAMEINGVSESSITAMVVNESAKSSLGAPNLMFLLLGVVAGALVSLGLVYLYHVESNRYD